MLDPERLRALAEASQARDEENAARELAQFRSETLAAFSEWLDVELERMAGFGYRSVTLRFEYGYVGTLGEAKPPGWHAYFYGVTFHSLHSADRVFRVGPHSLPIDRVAGCVIESAQGAGITANLVGNVGGAYELNLSW
jgi:hypothetical protein